MKNRIIILIISIIIALIVLGIGLYGLSNTKDDNKDKATNGDIEKSTEIENESSDISTVESDDEESINEENNIEETDVSEKEETSTSGNDVLVSTVPEASDIDPNKPMVALTYDDGPAGNNTLRILDTLKKYNARATFFVVGYNLDGNEEIIKKIAEQGSEVANHTASHKDLAKLTIEELNYEVNSVADKIKSLTGQKNVLIRPPYGSVNDFVMSSLTEPVILWSIDTEDWKTKNPEATLNHVKATVYDGAIILMHDLHSETADATEMLVEWLTNEGYQIVTVSEMGYYRRGGLQTGVRYGSLQP